MRAASLTTASALALLLAVSSLSAAVALEAPGSGVATGAGAAQGACMGRLRFWLGGAHDRVVAARCRPVTVLLLLADASCPPSAN
jgi:hypothetical protein